MSTYQTHGYTLSIDATGLKAQPDLLHASLGYQAYTLRPEQIQQCDIVQPATTFAAGAVAVHYAAEQGSDQFLLRFAPQTQGNLETVAQAIQACQRGEAPAPEIPGLDFVAIAVATANPDWASICQINALKVRNGVVVDERSWLCQPVAPYADFAAAYEQRHAITAAEVSDAPAVADVLRECWEFCDSLPLVAHNAAFHIGALYRAAHFAEVSLPTLRYGCTLTLARLQLQLENYQLPSVAAHFQVPVAEQPHALGDAHTTAAVMLEFAKQAASATPETQLSCEGVHQQLGAQLGTLQQDSYYPALRSPVALSPAAAPQNKQRGGRKAPWQRIATPDTIPEPAVDADPNDPLYQQHVTISGEFTPFDKGEIWEALAAHGAIIGKNVTKKTTILACGAWEGKTSKQKRAEELQAKGQDIAIWDMAQLLDALDLDSSTS